MHESNCINGVQPKALGRAELAGRNQFMVAGISVDDATAPSGYSLETALIEGLEENKDCTRLCSALHIDELVSAAELTGRDIVLNALHDHRDDGPWPGDARGLRHHARPQDLSLDLSEAGLQPTCPCSLGYQDSGGPHQRIDHVTDTKEELLHAPGNSGTDKGFVIVDLRLLQHCLRARLFGRQKRRNPQHSGFFCSIGAIEGALPPVHEDLQLFDVPLRDDPRVAPLQLALHLQLIQSLLMCAFRLLY